MFLIAKSLISFVELFQTKDTVLLNIITFIAFGSHVGLEPGTKYYYKCGDSSVPAMSEEHSFETMPISNPTIYPHRIGVIGDLGLTSNTTTTIDHLIKNGPSMVLMVGDLCYANQYLTTGGKGAPCYSCAFPDAPIRETYQPRWDGWGR